MVNYTSNEPFNQKSNAYQWIITPKESGVTSLNEILNQEKSIYLQISEMIENDILRDILLEEEKVSSTNELAKFFKINPATAAKGINLLVDEGILYKKRGIGMFVTQGAKQAVQKNAGMHFMKHISVLC